MLPSSSNCLPCSNVSHIHKSSPVHCTLLIVNNMLISDPNPEFRSSIISGTPREWYRNMRPAGLLAILMNFLMVYRLVTVLLRGSYKSSDQIQNQKGRASKLCSRSHMYKSKYFCMTGSIILLYLQMRKGRSWFHLSYKANKKRLFPFSCGLSNQNLYIFASRKIYFLHSISFSPLLSLVAHTVCVSSLWNFSAKSTFLVYCVSFCQAMSLKTHIFLADAKRKCSFQL